MKRLPFLDGATESRELRETLFRAVLIVLVWTALCIGFALGFVAGVSM